MPMITAELAWYFLSLPLVRYLMQYLVHDVTSKARVKYFGLFTSPLTLEEAHVHASVYRL